MPDYLTVRSHGAVTYCDGLVARIQADQAEAYLLSLVGSPEHIQVTSAHFTRAAPAISPASSPSRSSWAEPLAPSAPSAHAGSATWSPG